MIFLALCFHEIFPDEKIIPMHLASNRQSMYVETTNADGIPIRKERIFYEESFDKSKLKADQSVVYSSPLRLYLEAWMPENSARIATRFGGIELK